MKWIIQWSIAFMFSCIGSVGMLSVYLELKKNNLSPTPWLPSTTLKALACLVSLILGIVLIILNAYQ